MLSALSATSAGATVTLGSLDPHPDGNPSGSGPWEQDGYPNTECGYVETIYVPGAPPDPAATGRPDTTVPPGGGTITSWSTSGQHAGDQFRLVVTRFPTRDQVAIEARSQTVTIPDAGAHTFTTHIPVTGGEQIGLDAVQLTYPPEDCFFPASQDDFVYLAGDYTADGESESFITTNEGYPTRRVNVMATLATPTPSRRCVVPLVRRKTLARARRLLRTHHCRVGRVRHRPSRRLARGRVLGQGRRPGAIMRAGARVALVVSRGRPS